VQLCVFIVKFEQTKCQDLLLGLLMVMGNWDLVLSFNFGCEALELGRCWVQNIIKHERLRNQNVKGHCKLIFKIWSINVNQDLAIRVSK
jgi:hypothetical protein